jgi:PPP family 3-phenylpropionic acid transporter
VAIAACEFSQKPPAARRFHDGGLDRFVVGFAQLQEVGRHVPIGSEIRRSFAGRIVTISLMPLPRPATGADFAVRLAFFYSGVFLALGVQMPFLPAWLAAKGFDSAAIGLILAGPIVLRLAAVPIISGTADRLGAWRGILICTAFGTAAGYGLLTLADGFWAVLALFALAGSIFGSIFPLTDAYALRGLALLGRSYGPVRLWGSAAFVVGSLGAGVVAPFIPPRALIWLIVAAFVCAALSSLMLRPLPPQSSPVELQGHPARSWRSPTFIAVTAAASLIQASHAVYYGFSTIAWTSAGIDSRAIGFLWAIGVVAEIGLFAVSGKLPAWLGPAMLIGLGSAGAVVRWTVMALEPPNWSLPVLQCLHGLSFGATHLGSVQFVARVATHRDAATIQGYLSVSMGVVMALAMTAAGWLYGRYGSFAYLGMALTAGAGGLFAILADRLHPHRSGVGG